MGVKDFLLIFAAVLPAALAGQAVEYLGEFWENSKFFVTILVGMISLRVLNRILHGEWKFKHEWFAFILTFPLIVGGYVWIRSYETLFILFGGILFVVWATYVREMVIYLESRE